jgi:DNA-directed RNA polymerase subunit RPC12/RpoP
MPTVTTYTARFEQPVDVKFSCEYCSHEFAVTGKSTAEVKTQKWVTARREEAQAELRQKGDAALGKTRAELERLTWTGGNFPQRLDNEGSSLRFDAGSLCPACGYRQRMVIPPNGGRQPGIVKYGCGGILLIFFGMGILALVQGTVNSLGYVLIFGSLIVAGILLAILNRQPNRKFMKEHGLTKQDLPRPKKPEILYGPIRSV